MSGRGCVSWLGRVKKLPKQDGVQDVPRKQSICSNFVSAFLLQRSISARIASSVVF